MLNLSELEHTGYTLIKTHTCGEKWLKNVVDKIHLAVFQSQNIKERERIFNNFLTLKHNLTFQYLGTYSLTCFFMD